MKNSADWIRQEHVDAAADTLISEGAKVEGVTGYQVAKALGVEPNSSIYDKFNDWLKRKKAGGESAQIDVPSPMVAALKKSLMDEVQSRQDFLLDMLRSMSSTYSTNADLRVAAAERRVEQAVTMADDVLGSLRKLEDQHALTCEEHAAMQSEIEDLKAERSELKGILKVFGPMLEKMRSSQPKRNDAGEPGEDQISLF